VSIAVTHSEFKQVVNEAEPDVADEMEEVVNNTAEVPEAVIPVVESQALRTGVRVVIGSIRIGDLAPRLKVAIRDFVRKTGYQRQPSPTRVNQLAEDLRRGLVDLPTAVLLNIRKEQFRPELLEEVDGTHKNLRLGDEDLEVVDGQHRGLSLVQKLYADNPDRWGDYRIAASIMLGATEAEEMEQFHVVNSSAKSVPTDLALDLLKHRTENDPKLWAVLDERGQAWKVEAETLTEDLVKTSVWKDRIRFPGLPKADTMIGSASMVTSLRPVIQMSYFQMLAKPRQVAVLDAYWQGIRQVLPKVFFEPSDYALMKSTGVMVMHSLLPSVLEVASRGRTDTDPETYAELLRDALMDLQGSTTSGRTVSGEDFWLSGAEGAAGTYSSNAGRRVLLAMMRRGLPRLEQ